MNLLDMLLALSPELLALVTELVRALNRGQDPKEAMARIAEEHARSAALDVALTKAKG